MPEVLEMPETLALKQLGGAPNPKHQARTRSQRTCSSGLAEVFLKQRPTAAELVERGVLGALAGVPRTSYVP